MAEQSICCCIRGTNLKWAENKAIDASIWCCCADIETARFFDWIRICPVYTCVSCMTHTWVCPKDCCWFTSNCCSLCMINCKDICGDQLDMHKKYVCGSCHEPTLTEYADSLNNGLSRQDAYRGLFGLSPKYSLKKNLIEKPLDQYMY